MPPLGAPGAPVSLEVAEGVATVTLRSPPVNALNPELFDALFAALRKAQANPDVKAIVLTGSDGKFCAGFDFTLFATPAMSSLLDRRQDTVAQVAALLENGSNPTVAAIEGVALGGGLELAMACNTRVAAAGAQLGLPEVRLGVLPGMGGTQRLPRLVGMRQVLNLMLSGQPIPAEDGLAIGLVDEVAPAGQLLEAARRAAAALGAAVAAGKPGARRRTLQLTQHVQASGEVFADAAAALQEAQATVQRTLAGQEHYRLLLDACASGLMEGVPAGLQKEGEGFRACCNSRLHRMLLHMFKLHKSLCRSRGPAWALLQVQLFVGLAWIWFYVHLIYVWTSFMIGYRKARTGSKKKKEDESSTAAGGSGSGKAAGGGGGSRGAKKAK
ncbi:glyoxysomal fatty acid beta-oxidation multifunctional MFP-a [Micractinium conductrix]|uniref:Glyoxysomal fatty acid beta-oxidation multifunctional MFP-a n=1 Tax=Micractinium conductrix TaxID=554055 RepID=A0A2P6VEN6_9CHLO|nr:glyoxysomal fatty acid beta-oxidation multifunctional MFP-a [Micractinium conductrix]|eukprot:PSC72554.1 glyoxysomal fatty acid beta-oxidation multifunctional MFP-a [Micractinium conductrix]